MIRTLILIAQCTQLGQIIYEVALKFIQGIQFHKKCARTFVVLMFMFSMKATKFDEIFTVDLTLCSKSQIDGEDFVNSCGLLRKHEL